MSLDFAEPYYAVCEALGAAFIWWCGMWVIKTEE
jgi:hypothetical protein